MNIIKNNNWPKISIITCVYNGEKYISKLLDSVLYMGYPNIEHIIVNDGSTDSTEQIILKYAELYKIKENSALSIKYIKQRNKGLGGATNTGLKAITGEYWTWINCDDWYEKNCFFEPIRILTKKKNIDFVQMNGFFAYKDKEKSTIVKKNSKMVFNNRIRLFACNCYQEHFLYLLFVCRTSSYRRICPDMNIPYSRYTQDVQFVEQMFGVLRGGYSKEPSWYFLQREDSYLRTIKPFLSKSYEELICQSINSINIDSKTKRNLLMLHREELILRSLKFYSLRHLRTESLKKFKELVLVRLKMPLNVLIFLDHKALLYLIFTFCTFLKKN